MSWFRNWRISVVDCEKENLGKWIWVFEKGNLILNQKSQHKLRSPAKISLLRTLHSFSFQRWETVSPTLFSEPWTVNVNRRGRHFACPMQRTLHPISLLVFGEGEFISGFRLSGFLTLPLYPVSPIFFFFFKFFPLSHSNGAQVRIFLFGWVKYFFQFLVGVAESGPIRMGWEWRLFFEEDVSQLLDRWIEKDGKRGIWTCRILRLSFALILIHNLFSRSWRGEGRYIPCFGSCSWAEAARDRYDIVF